MIKKFLIFLISIFCVDLCCMDKPHKTTLEFAEVNVEDRIPMVYVPDFSSISLDRNDVLYTQIANMLLCSHKDCSVTFFIDDNEDPMRIMSDHYTSLMTHNPRGFQMLQEFISSSCPHNEYQKDRRAQNACYLPNTFLPKGDEAVISTIKDNEDPLSIVFSHIVSSQEHNQQGFELLREFIAPTLPLVGMVSKSNTTVCAKKSVSPYSVKIICAKHCGYECVVPNNDKASYLLTHFLLQHNLMHCHAKYNEIKKYLTANALQKVASYDLTCPHCSFVISVSNRELLLSEFIGHLATEKHNKEGFACALSYVEKYKEYVYI